MTTKELTRSSTQPARQAQRRFDPFDILQQEIDNVFSRFSGDRAWPSVFSEGWTSLPAGSGFSPSMEVTETDGMIEVSTELPGMDEKDVEISLTDGMLTIRGEKKLEKEEKKKSYRLVERSYGAFERAVAIPPGVDASKVKAKMTKGVLRLEIPKPAAVSSQQVKIATE